MGFCPCFHAKHVFGIRLEGVTKHVGDLFPSKENLEVSIFSGGHSISVRIIEGKDIALVFFQAHTIVTFFGNGVDGLGGKVGCRKDFFAELLVVEELVGSNGGVSSIVVRLELYFVLEMTLTTASGNWGGSIGWRFRWARAKCLDTFLEAFRGAIFK